MQREWREKGVFEATLQRVYDQARAVRKNARLTDLKLEKIRRNVWDVNEQDEIEDEENTDNYNDTEHIKTTEDDSEIAVEEIRC